MFKNIYFKSVPDSNNICYSCDPACIDGKCTKPLDSTKC